MDRAKKILHDVNNTIVEWTIHPVRENRLQAGLVTVVVIGVAYALALLTGDLTWAVFYFAIFCLSLHRYFFPTHYHLTSKLLLVKRPWRSYSLQLDEFRSFTETGNGIQLNRMEHDSFIDRLRGVFILTGDKHARIVDQLQTQMQMT